MDKEQKLFSYDELKAMCLLCATQGLVIGVSNAMIDPIKGRKDIEKEVEEIINIRWNQESKNIKQ